MTGKSKAATNKSTDDYANDPYFIKKRETAEKFLKKAGLPESFTKAKKVICNSLVFISHFTCSRISAKEHFYLRQKL